MTFAKKTLHNIVCIYRALHPQSTCTTGFYRR